MNELGLTHIESLDSEQVSIPGIDIDAALESTIARGKKKIRNRRIIGFSSGLAGLLVVCLAIFSLVYDFSQTRDDQNVSIATANNVKSATKVKGETITKDETPAVTTATVAASVKTAPKPQAIVPSLVPILQYGNSSLCTPSPDPALNTATSISKWNPQIGESTTIYAGNVGHPIVLKNVASNQATNGAYVNMVSGYSQTNSFANITTLGFTYCETGYKLSITSQGSGGGYVLSTEGW